MFKVYVQLFYAGLSYLVNFCFFHTIFIFCMLKMKNMKPIYLIHQCQYTNWILANYITLNICNLCQHVCVCVENLIVSLHDGVN